MKPVNTAFPAKFRWFSDTESIMCYRTASTAGPVAQISSPHEMQPGPAQKHCIPPATRSRMIDPVPHQHCPYPRLSCGLTQPETIPKRDQQERQRQSNVVNVRGTKS